MCRRIRAVLERALYRGIVEYGMTKKRDATRDPAQGRQVHLVGPIMVWLGEASDLEIADAANLRDTRGTEGISADDVRWTAITKPAGLLAGLPLTCPPQQEGPIVSDGDLAMFGHELAIASIASRVRNRTRRRSIMNARSSARLSLG